VTSENLRALVVTGRYPIGVPGGDTHRCRLLIDNLIYSGYDVDLLALSENRLDKPVFNSNLKHQYILSHSRTFSMVYSLARIAKLKPLQASYYVNRQTLRQLKQFDYSKYDLVVIHLSRLEEIKSLVDNTETKIIIDMCDIMALNYKKAWRSKSLSKRWRAVTFIEGLLMTRKEREILRSEYPKLLISRRDLVYAKKYLEPETKLVHFLPNYIDYKCRRSVDLAQTFIKKNSSDVLKIAFIGNMSASHNTSAINNLIEGGCIQKWSDLSIKLVVAGKMNYSVHEDFKKAGIIVRPDPVDIFNAVSDCYCGISPLVHCAGMQNKLIDYAAFGLPILATSYSADGLEMQPSKHYLEAMSSNDFFEKTVFLLENLDEAILLAERAYSHVQELFDKDKIQENFKSIINTV